MTTPSATGRVLGNYVLQALLGRGGMSVVYAAEHRFLGDAVAVKLLHPHLAESEEQAARFLQEATRTRAIDHPNVVRVLDFGRAEDDGAPYLVMERLAGADLRARLGDGKRVDEAEARRIGAAIADGMAAAHAVGIVHRDLKPANVLLLPDGRLKIIDFGIARLLTAGTGATGNVGTPEYMAPEQIGGGLIGPFVDVYALGVLLFEAVTGALPFTGFDEGACPQLFLAPRRPSELAPLSGELEELILQCLRKNPTERPASMMEVAGRLRQTGSKGERATVDLGSRPVAAPAPAAARRRRWRPIAGGAALLVVLGLVALWRHPTARPVATSMPVAPIATPIVNPTATPPIATPIATPTGTTPAPTAATTPPTPTTSTPREVVVRSRPPGARIVIDGVVRARTPSTLSLPLPLTLLVTLPGYRPARLLVDRPGLFEVRLARDPRTSRSPIYRERLD